MGEAINLFEISNKNILELKGKDFLQLSDFSTDQILYLLKQEHNPSRLFRHRQMITLIYKKLSSYCLTSLQSIFFHALVK